MDCPFHYEVRLTGVRYNSKDDIEFKSKKRVFNDENPLVSRKKSLDFYENYISGVLKHLGYSNKSDRESRRILQVLFEKGSKIQIPIKDFDPNISDILFFGIGVYFVIDKENERDGYIKKDNEFNFFTQIPRSSIIHGIGFNGMNVPTNPEHLIVFLYDEVTEYRNYGYDLTGLTKIVEVYEYEIEDSDYNEILPTPFDWTGFDVPFREGRLEPLEVVWDIPPVEPVVLDGESNKVEYKSTLKYNLGTQKNDPILKSVIGKTICGFLNSEGGLLFIGVNDKGIPIGLKNDFSLYKSENPKDSFLKDFDNLIKTYLPQWIHNKIDVEFKEYSGVEIFIVSVSPSLKTPVFFNGDKGKEFYIRRSVSTTQLDVEDFFFYWKDHWDK